MADSRTLATLIKEVANKFSNKTFVIDRELYIRKAYTYALSVSFSI